MMKRVITILGVLSAIAVALVTTATVSGQSASAPPLVVTAYNNGPAIPYTVPKTPWGDPDLQGVWSSDDTQGIPMQRPQNVEPACIRPMSSGPRVRSRRSRASRMR